MGQITVASCQSSWSFAAHRLLIIIISSFLFLATTTAFLSNQQYRPYQPRIHHNNHNNRNLFDSINSMPADNSIIVTIGPPTCGKTTWLRELDDSVVDLALDDQPNVYVSLDTKDYLFMYRYKQQQRHNSSTKSWSDEAEQILQRLQKTVYYNKTLMDRLLAPKENELISILQCFAGNIAVDELRTMLPPTEIHNILVTVVDEYIQAQQQSQATTTTTSPPSQQQPPIIQLPTTIDLYIVESLFAGGVIQQTNQKLWTHANTNRTYPIAWGNTNTQPREYQAALEFAWKQQRPVLFCTFEPLQSVKETGANDDDDDNHTRTSIFDLRVDSFHTLLTRSIDRLMRTGRYVPAQTIWDMNERWKKTLLDVEAKLRVQERQDEADAGDTITSSQNDEDRTSRHPLALVQRLSKAQLHFHLANLAGYEMDSRRCVAPILSRKASGYRPQNAGRGDNRAQNQRAVNILRRATNPIHDRPSTGQRSGPSQRMRVDQPRSDGLFRGSVEVERRANASRSPGRYGGSPRDSWERFHNGRGPGREPRPWGRG